MNFIHKHVFVTFNHRPQYAFILGDKVIEISHFSKHFDFPKNIKIDHFGEQIDQIFGGSKTLAFCRDS